jgi:hypothetical protein
VSTHSHGAVGCEYSLSKTTDRAGRFVDIVQSAIAPNLLHRKMLHKRYYYFPKLYLASLQCFCSR